MKKHGPPIDMRLAELDELDPQPHVFVFDGEQVAALAAGAQDDLYLEFHGGLYLCSDTGGGRVAPMVIHMGMVDTNLGDEFKIHVPKDRFKTVMEKPKCSVGIAWDGSEVSVFSERKDAG